MRLFNINDISVLLCQIFLKKLHFVIEKLFMKTRKIDKDIFWR